MMVCFERDLVNDWPRIARNIMLIGKQNEGVQYFWNFLDFVVTHRTPLYLLLQAFILQRVSTF